MNETTSTKNAFSPQERREIVKWIVQSALGLVGYGLILIPINPSLLVERERGLRDPRVKSWDRWIAALGGGVFPWHAGSLPG
jgi:hypothetical protein